MRQLFSFKRLTFAAPAWVVMFTLAAFLFAFGSIASAQDNGDGGELEETLKQLSEDAAAAYVSPVVSAFGSNLNGGWFHKAPPPKMFSLNIEGGLKVMGTFFPDEVEYQHFSTSGEFRFDTSLATQLVNNTPGLSFPNDDVKNALITAIANADFTVGISGATIIGASDDYIEIEFSGAEVTFEYPEGSGVEYTYTIDPDVLTLEGIGGLGDFLAEISFLPFAAPQIGIGTVLGTKVTFRYIPEINIPLVDITEDIGTFSWFGFGIQHNPGVFFPTPLPVDLSVGFFKQTLKLGEILETNTTTYGLNASKKLGIGPINITPYAGFMFEKSTMHFTYDFILDEGTADEQVIDIDFELEGENKSRLIIGVSLKLLMFNINADYNIGKYNSITLGLMFGI